jgi:hypothetical protein
MRCMFLFCFEDLGIESGIILKWNLKTVCEDVDWIHLTQNRVQWLVLVETEMTFKVQCKAGNFVTS